MWLGEVDSDSPPNFSAFAFFSSFSCRGPRLERGAACPAWIDTLSPAAPVTGTGRHGPAGRRHGSLLVGWSRKKSWVHIAIGRDARLPRHPCRGLGQAHTSVLHMLRLLDIAAVIAPGRTTARTRRLETTVQHQMTASQEPSLSALPTPRIGGLGWRACSCRGQMHTRTHTDPHTHAYRRDAHLVRARLAGAGSTIFVEFRPDVLLSAASLCVAYPRPRTTPRPHIHHIC